MVLPLAVVRGRNRNGGKMVQIVGRLLRGGGLLCRSRRVQNLPGTAITHAMETRRTHLSARLRLLCSSAGVMWGSNDTLTRFLVECIVAIVGIRVPR